MYRDIATMDQGPGYLNGILSLILNTTQPASQYSEEEQRAVPYFHRSRAAELLALLDAKFPNSAAASGAARATARVLFATRERATRSFTAGANFLRVFPMPPSARPSALLMADAYARKSDTKNEFAIYDSVLQELAAKAQNVPLGIGRRMRANSANHYAVAAPINPMNTSEAEGERHEGETNKVSERGQTRTRFPASRSASRFRWARPLRPRGRRARARRSTRACWSATWRDWWR